MFSKENAPCRPFVIKAIEKFKDGVFNTFISYYQLHYSLNTLSLH